VGLRGITTRSNTSLIRIRTHGSDADATIYVVAEAEVDKAIAILQRAISQPNSEYEDLAA
jgi:hypothetical protein